MCDLERVVGRVVSHSCHYQREVSMSDVNSIRPATNLWMDMNAVLTAGRTLLLSMFGIQEAIQVHRMATRVGNCGVKP